MNKKNYLYTLVTVFLLIITVVPVTAQETGKDTPQIDENAVSILQNMFDFLAKSKTISVTIEFGYDALQKSGQLIEFGGTSKWIISRPNHVRIQIEGWSGMNRTFYFDGKDITLFDSNENAYATVSKLGTLDQAFDYYMDELNMPLPLAELFSSEHPFDLKKDVISALDLGDSTISGVKCDELAFQFETLDLQIWIAQGDKPLPQRAVITYKEAEGHPQYRTQFKDWDLSPKVPDSLFAFKAPEGAEKIKFLPLKRAGAVKEESKGGKKQ